MFASDGATATVNPEAVRATLFADSSDDDYQRYIARIRPEPLAVATAPVKVTPDRFGTVPKAYIECRHDRGISIALQQRMHAATSCQAVIAMDTGHMPMYAAPTDLARHLMTLASH